MHNSIIQKPCDLPEISHHHTMSHNLTTEQLVAVATEAVGNALPQIPAQEHTPEVVSMSDAVSKIDRMINEEVDKYHALCLLPASDSIPKTHPEYAKLNHISQEREMLVDKINSSILDSA